MSMNEHANKCLDESMKKEEMKKNTMMNDHDYDEDDDINPKSNSKPKQGVMSREQMIECASKLMTLQQGSEQFDNMLDMFGALGFNKANVKSVLEIERKEKEKEKKKNKNINKNKNYVPPGNINNDNNQNQNFNNMNYTNMNNMNNPNNNNNNNFNV